MCYSRAVDRIGIRELRNYASRVVRRAQAGERIVITVDGVPAAQIVPLTETTRGQTLDDLIAAGLVWPRRTAAPAQPASPVRVAGRRTTTEILRRHRNR
jgi:prevent-host-death family protein